LTDTKPRTDLVLQSANTDRWGSSRVSSSTKASFTNNCTADTNTMRHDVHCTDVSYTERVLLNSINLIN